MNEIKEESHKWKDIPRSWIRRLNILKMSVLPNLIYRVNEISTKIPESYFMDIDKMTPKFIWRGKIIINTTLKEKKVNVPKLSNFKTHHTCRQCIGKRIDK